MIIKNMATTWRHNEFVVHLGFAFMSAMKGKKARFATEEVALVYEGNLGEECCRLVDISLIKDKEYFAESTIEYFRFVQPDLFIFNHDNLYITNKRELRVAGRPNIIVEVWSDGNLKYERQYKQELYSTSPITEHWYIEQDNNTVVCYKGKERLPNQNIMNNLKTYDNIIINISHLAL